MRQPAIFRRARRRQPQAIAHAPHAVGIIGAAAGVAIEEPAGDVGVIDAARVLVLELHQTAAPATVAKRFPLGAGHGGEGFAEPK